MIARKDYRLTIKIRNNNILSFAEKAGFSSMPKLAESIGWNYAGLNDLVNMTISPFGRNGVVKPFVEKLCISLNASFDELFSADQCEALATNKADREIDAEQMYALTAGSMAGIDHVERISTTQLGDSVKDAMEFLTDQQRTVISLRFGFTESALTLEEVGKEIGVSRERVRQIEAYAIRKLRCSKIAEIETMRDRFRSHVDAEKHA